MFKIENLIAPIIVEQMAKYVKNFRKEDLQMSLWGGEVTLQNLDLRLEEIEEELNLPFHLISGRINELSIEIPWKNLLSNSIRININTMEFVLKSKDLRKWNHRKSVKKTHNLDKSQTLDDPTDYDLTNKINDEDTYFIRWGRRIINNINATCENIIFKYIEQDIVLSLNLHLFNICTVNDKWQADVEDITAPRVISRKLITILYLSLCLDKHSTSGEVHACHEPILYRCSLQCRVLRSFSAQTKDTCSTTRIAVFTSAIDLNLSSMQVPMLMRFIKALLVLVDSENKVREMRVPCQNQEPQLCITEDGANESESETESEKPTKSYFAWAWSFVPQFLSGAVEEEEEEDCPGHITEVGVYVEQLKFTIKNSEYSMDASIGGAIVVIYKPILQLILKGVYFEKVTVKEIDWKNIKVGVSNILLNPLDPDKKYYDNDAYCEFGSTKKGVKNICAFLDKSLFDDDYKTPTKGWFVINYEDYIKRFTDAYLLRRTPVFVFDEVEYCSDVDEMDDEIDPNLTTRSEKKCLHKQIRVMGTGVVLRYNETYLKKRGTPMFEFTRCMERGTRLTVRPSARSTVRPTETE